jgi:hypothetical protein
MPAIQFVAANRMTLGLIAGLRLDNDMAVRNQDARRSRVQRLDEPVRLTSVACCRIGPLMNASATALSMASRHQQYSVREETTRLAVGER